MTQPVNRDSFEHLSSLLQTLVKNPGECASFERHTLDYAGYTAEIDLTDLIGRSIRSEGVETGLGTHIWIHLDNAKYTNWSFWYKQEHLPDGMGRRTIH